MKLANPFRFLKFKKNISFAKILINDSLIYKKNSYHHHHFHKFSLANNIINKSVSSSLLFQNSIQSNKYQTKNDSAYSYSTTTSGLFIKEIIKNTTSLSIKWSNSNSFTKFNYIWLRDTCQCPLCIHPDSRQKLFSSSEVPLDIKPISIEFDSDKLVILWDKGLQSITYKSNANNNSHKPHESTYPISFLHSYSTKENISKLRYDHLKPILWDRSSLLKSSQNLWTTYYDYMNSDKNLLDTLRQILDYGLVIIKNVPTDEDGKGIISVAERIGTIKSTFYGKVFDVKSIPAANNIAYTDLHLGLHMDLLYYDAPPGLQFLQCIKNSVTGGQSIFSDSFKAINNLKLSNPNYFNLLTKFPIPFHYKNNGHHLHYNRPAIVIDDNNETLNVNYSPPFQGPIEFNLDTNHDEADLIEFYKAYQQFCICIENPSLIFEFTLKPGDLVIFVNRRVLHGRKSFDSRSGQRHLKGTYVEYSEFKDRLMALMEKKNNNKL
ncbi:hypothetical protein RclHR1_16890007 [Rhizophagus clarus]|uniref:Clavaminate synthase-like protein n=1 Tax=Rhizophagus clarus TaxID=94130 RepID=A0A2Z6QQW0_9GLOM|nr:hypothetical protein RclHR1_13830001 [Rhizophagus clarus]GBB90015.1 hypothetical protein RclHR1_16890007 [Rhizophagus clarus]GES97792.1 clavaminate synthase-like protein [Rhizophagus clarus]